MRHGLWICTALLLAGCATPDSRDPVTAPISRGAPMTQQDRAEKARVYREEARQYREMAQRRQAEADLLARDLGQGHAAVQQKRQLAMELQARADEADRISREFRQQVPHNMYQ